jgi:hypothetical protein
MNRWHAAWQARIRCLQVGITLGAYQLAMAAMKTRWCFAAGAGVNADGDWRSLLALLA